MASLSGNSISNTYEGLLKLEDSTSGITTNLQNITDGLGNPTGLKIGENYFQSNIGIHHYPLEPNTFYGNGFANFSQAVAGTQPNNSSVGFFYDRGIESYSAITFNISVALQPDEELNFAFYKLGFIESEGYVPTERVSNILTYTGTSTGLQTLLLNTNLSFTGTGAGVYGFVYVYKTGVNPGYTGRFGRADLNLTTINGSFGFNFGFVINSLNNAAPMFFKTLTTSAVTGGFLLTGDTLPTTYTSANYPQILNLATSVGFILHTIK